MQMNLDGIFPMAVEPATMVSSGDTKGEVSRTLPSNSLKFIEEDR